MLVSCKVIVGKDCVPLLSNVVYKLKRSNCRATYFGTTNKLCLLGLQKHLKMFLVSKCYKKHCFVCGTDSLSDSNVVTTNGNKFYKLTLSISTLLFLSELGKG